MFKSIVWSIVVASLSMIIIGGLMYAVGARINISKSIPCGVYWISNMPIEKGEYVIFCPPQNQIFKEVRDRGYIGSGFCPGGYSYMMKKILAAKNDTVLITPQGVNINGDLLPYSKPLCVDKLGRPLPYMINKSYVLKESEVLLMSDISASSFDARYFGPLNKAQIKSVIRPVFTW